MKKTKAMVTMMVMVAMLFTTNVVSVFAANGEARTDKYKISASDIDAVTGEMSREKSRIFEKALLDNVKLNDDGKIIGIVPDVLPEGYMYTMVIDVVCKNDTAYQVLQAEIDDTNFFNRLNHSKATLDIGYCDGGLPIIVGLKESLDQIQKVIISVGVCTHNELYATSGFEAKDLVSDKIILDWEYQDVLIYDEN